MIKFIDNKNINFLRLIDCLLHIHSSSNYFLAKTICLNYCVKVIDIVVIGTEKHILKKAPLNNEKNP